jgi:hypothetical protein
MRLIFSYVQGGYPQPPADLPPSPCLASRVCNNPSLLPPLLARSQPGPRTTKAPRIGHSKIPAPLLVNSAADPPSNTIPAEHTPRHDGSDREVENLVLPLAAVQVPVETISHTRNTDLLAEMR